MPRLADAGPRDARVHAATALTALSAVLVVGLKPRHALIRDGVAVLVDPAANLDTGNRRIVRCAVTATTALRELAIPVHVGHPAMTTAPAPAAEARLTHGLVAVRITHAGRLFDARAGRDLAEVPSATHRGVHTSARRIAGVDGARDAVIAVTHKRVRTPSIHAAIDARIVMVRCITKRRILMVSCVLVIRIDPSIALGWRIQAECVFACIDRLCSRAAEEAEGEEDWEMAKGHVGQL
jgi:hypothetical protein